MAGESIRVPSTFVALLSGAAVGAGAVSGESTSINASALSANEKLYDLADFELVVTGTPSADGDVVELLRRPKANGANAPAPTLSYRQQYVDGFVLKAEAGGSYKIYNANVGDNLDTYYLVNNSGALTFTLNVRTRTAGPAA